MIGIREKEKKCITNEIVFRQIENALTLVRELIYKELDI
jgi:hypothetical protein